MSKESYEKMSELKFSICKMKRLHTNLSSNRNEKNWMCYPLYTSRSLLDLFCLSNLIYNKDILAYLSNKKSNLKYYIHYFHEYKLYCIILHLYYGNKILEFQFSANNFVIYFLIASINILLKISQLS
jgi:hypothetical protein